MGKKYGVLTNIIAGVQVQYLPTFSWCCFPQAILTLGDNGRMELNEFVQFVTEQQRKLWDVFSSLDTNGCVVQVCS